MKTYPTLFSIIVVLVWLVSPSVQANANCTPEHAAMGHCTMTKPIATAKPAPKPVLAPKPASTCTPEHAAMGHCTMTKPAAPKPVPKPVPAPKPASTCTPEHAAMGHCTMTKPIVPAKPAPKPVPVPKPSSTCTPEHAAMGHCTMTKPIATAKPAPKPVLAPKPASTCTPEHAAMGHCTMNTPTVPSKSASTCTPEHAAMGHCTMLNEPAIPVSDGSADTYIPMPYHNAMDMNDDPSLSKVMIDRFEIRNGEHENPIILEADAWFGKTINKLKVKTDIEAVKGDIKEAQLQVLYNRAISSFWDMQAGIRHDFEPEKRTWATLGVQGTAPYFIETNAAAFFGEQGRSALRLSAEKEVMLTQKTALVPKLGVNLHGKNDPTLGIGSGISDVNVGIRLRHEIKREFAPYVGVNWSKKMGNTAELAREQGEKTQDTVFSLGIQAWF